MIRRQNAIYEISSSHMFTIWPSIHYLIVIVIIAVLFSSPFIDEETKAQIEHTHGFMLVNDRARI